MTWTSTKPLAGYWYWYREAGLNLDKPMPAWIFDTGGNMVYATLCAVHQYKDFRHTRNLQACKGEWWGPVEMPT